MTSQAKVRFTQAAALRGQNLSEFLYDLAQRESEALLEAEQRTRLSEADSLKLAQALLEPKPMSEAWQEALEVHRTLVRSR